MCCAIVDCILYESGNWNKEKHVTFKFPHLMMLLSCLPRTPVSALSRINRSRRRLDAGARILQATSLKDQLELSFPYQRSSSRFIYLYAVSKQRRRYSTYTPPHHHHRHRHHHRQRPPLADRTSTVDPRSSFFETVCTTTSPFAHTLAGWEVQCTRAQWYYAVRGPLRNRGGVGGGVDWGGVREREEERESPTSQGDGWWMVVVVGGGWWVELLLSRECTVVEDGERVAGRGGAEIGWAVS